MRNLKAQMMVLESISFAILMIVALIFVYQITPSPLLYKSAPANQLAIIANDALRSVAYKESTIGGYENFLAQCIGENDIDALTYLINLSIPDNVYYNIYIGNGTSYTLLYSDENVVGGKFGDVSKAYRVLYIDGNVTGIDGRTVTGNIYEVIMEVWKL